MTHEVVGGRIVIFDLWEFDGDFYDITTYVMEDKGQAESSSLTFGSLTETFMISQHT